MTQQGCTTLLGGLCGSFGKNSDRSELVKSYIRSRLREN